MTSNSEIIQILITLPLIVVQTIKNSSLVYKDEVIFKYHTIKSHYCHHANLGGDEVGTNCWKNNTEIANFMKEKNITDARLLEAYYLGKIFDIVESYKLQKKSYAIWQEAYQNGQGQLSKNAIGKVKFSIQSFINRWQ